MGETGDGKEYILRKEPFLWKRKKLAIGLSIGLLISGILGIVLLAYFSVASYFRSHFFPNTFVSGVRCSYWTAARTAAQLEALSLDYQLVVEDRDGKVIGTIGAADIDVTVPAKERAEVLLAGQDEYEWPFAFFRSQEYEFSYEMGFDEAKMEALIRTWEALRVTDMEEPKDAYISEYLGAEDGNGRSAFHGYEIIPETLGNKLDLEKVREVLAQAIYGRSETVNLGQEGCYVAAKITSSNVNLNRRVKLLNRWVGTRITYDWNGNEVVLDGTAIHTWIREEAGKVVLDEGAVEDFVASNARQYDTYGKKRTFRTTLGKELTLSSGAFGWKTDRRSEKTEIIRLIYEGAQLEREPVYSSRGAKKGTDDIGSSYVEIDLTNQHLYLYMEGKLILESDFVSGNMSNGNGTPAGVFGLTYKTTNAVLRGEDYATPVNYWMPFNGNVGMHDATWRRSFGGDIFLTGGSHGCINMPLAAAKTMYSYLSTGFPVICYYD
ncbi:MAG: L,D-transpeptidase/peptidoglycan binding protein [Clostridium sp.]|jgi:hypothetical protein|nr:L,D-transpeptidase/peptidoglycan binding protein [Clostridium sp.]